MLNIKNILINILFISKMVLYLHHKPKPQRNENDRKNLYKRNNSAS